ncbi:MAG: hypothetical protein NXI10_17050 [bacterium]|nr:hypothetical protein [bacterium]
MQKIVVLLAYKSNFRKRRMNNIGLIVRKYSVPFLFTVIGLFVLIFGLMEGQGMKFLLAAAMILMAGVLSTLFSLGKLKPKMVMIIGGAFGALALILFWFSIDTVSESLEYQNKRDKSLEIAKQNMIDIRFLQKVHKEKYGTYIDNWDDLIAFAKTGTMPSVISKGTVPAIRITPEERDFLYGDDRPIDNNMSEDEAYRLSKWKEGPRYDSLFAGFVRDTIQVPILRTKFKNRSYVENRKKLDIYPFSADSLPYIPYTNGKKMWSLQTRDSIKVGEEVGPAILVEGFLPFAKMEGSDKKIKVFFGSLTTFDMEGSWEQED